MPAQVCTHRALFQSQCLLDDSLSAAFLNGKAALSESLRSLWENARGCQIEIKAASDRQPSETINGESALFLNWPTAAEH
jgi:hypothetical protein